MVCTHKLWLFLLVHLTHELLVKAEVDWDYDVVALQIEDKTPEKLVVDLYVTRPARGVFAVSGVMNFKVDVTDEAIVSAETFYSQSDFMNIYYKKLIVPGLENCTENAPEIDGEFIAPLTKREMRMKDCFVENKNMKWKTRSGFYKVIYRFQNLFESTIVILVEVYPTK